jgi:hypothetical protein
VGREVWGESLGGDVYIILLFVFFEGVLGVWEWVWFDCICKLTVSIYMRERNQ